ncbi:1-deoxy-D-xylulose-5-phosphate synthase [Magnetococcus marinus MC-1]|uniref:1-deoxy-D-xylulose-5-phosphate synthase n=1 Tax=Magnetococcus marinus (strain ATCC BAA-1437 / JCM 17883 / MC-1) TaxID=156889 RepID=DXS_MAGMM|nr:1-deoxy-D-xylulose-5-phosphate synthase [Magnetococcus marinus]A0L6H3.1 RecName: Full=1-deoxy-D-xylulose-5-phosphate synthase; AltName: Full=1-deoxyxylulose-5-phosphate synthase; Short=DXP synthase; Short=DXPS [Magnetococcus marinus MC-1]ABK43566.1 1-deoxy-D-xylulose-5-phosphate synthase [Magnetococcus marinus MC-1]
MTTLLSTIDSPKALRQLNEAKLPQVAQEMRDHIIECVSQSGGHLGASLGVVELTIALHYVFNTPDDRLVWDVGHQSYGHKVLTGRRDQLASIRQRHGLSGFTKRSESPYDPFGTGHSSTSISAAMGMARAAKANGIQRKAVAVIGDGAMGAGMAFEALNHAGHDNHDLDLVVVLNDNEMSISPNVGALSSYLNRMLSGGAYNAFRDGTGKVLKTISRSMWDAAKKAEEHVKGLVMPGTLFEELGFTYFGPINGHDFDALLPTLRNVQKLGGPILLHVITKKGKGFPPAEEHPCTYHGVAPFDKDTGIIQSSSGGTSYTKVFAQELCALAEQNPHIHAITAAMREGTGLNLFEKRFPERFHDVGIAEQHAVTFAAGLATEGILPVVAIYSTFMQRAYDQLIHDVALQDLPVIFALDRAGLVGADGATHAGAYDLSYLRTVPGMTIMAPADENELRHMLHTAVALNKPVALRYPRGTALGLPPEPPHVLEIGRGRTLRKGEHAAILAVGQPVHPALEAAAILEQQGISVSVYDARFVKPLDQRLLQEVAMHGVVLVVEENAVQGGFGSAVLESLSNQGALDRGLKIRCMGIPDRYIPHGTQKELRGEIGLDAVGIATTLKELLG